MDTRERITLVTGVSACVQLVAMLFTENALAVFLPPALASLPIASLTMRSPETIALMRPNLGRGYIGMAVLSCAVVGWFLWSGSDLPFDLKVTRAILADVAIFWLASILGAQFAPMRKA